MRAPESWRTAQIADICDRVVVGHVGPSKEHRVPEGIPFLMGKNVRANGLELEDLEFVSREFHASERKSQLSPGDVVVVRIGKSGTAAVIPEDLGQANCAGLIAIKGLRDVTPEFLARYLNSADGQRASLAQTKGSTRMTLNTRSVASTEVPVPPRPEQDRIVSLLDKADAIRRKHHEAIALSEDLPLAIYSELFGDPVTNDRGWPASTIGDETSISSGATPSKQEPSFWGGRIPWVSPKDMKCAYLEDAQDHISEAAVAQGRVQIVAPGAVLIVVRGMILAHTMPVALSCAPLTINQDLKAVRPSDRAMPEFLLWTLRAMSGFLLARISTAAHGTKRLDLASLRGTPIVLPPLEVQEQFCRSIETVRALEAQLRDSAQEPLFESLSQRAFRDKL